MKTVWKILLAVFSLILAVILVWGGIMFIYYPQYKSDKKEIYFEKLVPMFVGAGKSEIQSFLLNNHAFSASFH